MKKLLLVTLLIYPLLWNTGCNNNNNKGSGDDNVNNGNNNNHPGENITIDHIDGLYAAPDSIRTDVPVTFYIRINNNTGKTITAASNGFKIWSPDNVQWNTTIGDTTSSFGKALFDGGVFINNFSITGSGADTVGFGGFKIQAGVPDGFDEVAYTIQIGPINSSYHGQQICIDSTFYPPGGAWLWALSGGSSLQPDWDGQRCFRIINPSAVSGK